MLSTIEKASALLKDDSVTLKDIHLATGISQKTLSRVRNSQDIAQAVQDLKYSEVEALIGLFNDIQINYLNEHYDNAFYKFVIRFGEWFEDAIEIQEDYYDSDEAMEDDLKIATAVQTLNDISTKDKSIMLDLYFSYSRDQQDMK